MRFYSIAIRDNLTISYNDTVENNKRNEFNYNLAVEPAITLAPAFNAGQVPTFKLCFTAA
jgi:hypothetical protein